MKKSLKTILDYVRYACTQFALGKIYYGHGTDRAWDEACTLVFCALELPQDIDARVLNARLTLEERQKILDWIRRRVDERLPLSYLTQRAWFAGLEFFVDPRVLIPRSPMAELIQAQFEPWIVPEKVDRILDLCTGSGCIAIACAYAFPDAAVDAVDLSEGALEVAEINVKRHELEDQVHVIQSDLFSALKGQVYDIIISNPPYVGLEEWEALPQEYTHEPKLALVAQDDGLDLVLKILREAKDFLTPSGILIVEVGNTMELLQTRFPDVPFVWLDFTHGEDGVFLLTREQLKGYFS